MVDKQTVFVSSEKVQGEFSEREVTESYNIQTKTLEIRINGMFMANFKVDSVHDLLSIRDGINAIIGAVTDRVLEEVRGGSE